MVLVIFMKKIIIFWVNGILIKNKGWVMKLNLIIQVIKVE